MTPHADASDGSLPPELSPLQGDDPRELGRFLVVGRLGGGSTGTVYGALDPDDHCAAVRVPRRRGAAHRERFTRAAERASRVAAVGAAAFLGADPDGDPPWLATEFVPGRTLRQHVRERGPLGEWHLRAFAACTAEGLAALHTEGVARVSLDPDVVVLSPEAPRLLDLGAARGAEPDRGRTADTAVVESVAAWGQLVLFAATGHEPGDDADPDAAAAPGPAALDRADLPEEVRVAVAAALAPDPGDRPDAQTLARRILAAADPADVRRVAGPGVGALVDPVRDLLEARWTGFDVAGHAPFLWVAHAWYIGAGAARPPATEPPIRPVAALHGRAPAAGGAPDGGGASATRPENGGSAVGDTAAERGHPSGDSTDTRTGDTPGGDRSSVGSAPAGAPVAPSEPAAAPASTVSPTSPTPSGTAGIVAAVAGAARGRAGVVVAVVAVLVLLVAVGWFVVAQVRSGASGAVDPGAPSPATATGADPFPNGQEVEFRGMTLLVPEDWAVVTIESSFTFPGGPAIPPVEEWVVLVPDPEPGCDEDTDWAWGQAHPCPHTQLLGPAGIEFGGFGGAAFQEDEVFSYSVQVETCPDGPELYNHRDVGEAGENLRGGVEPLVAETVPVGDTAMAYREWDAPCLTSADVAADYHQRLWYLPEHQILAVDEWSVDGLDDILGAAELGEPEPE